MNVDAANVRATGRIVAEHARAALERSALLFAKGEPPPTAEPDLVALAGLYGVRRFTDEPLWRLRDRVRDVLESHANATERPEPLPPEQAAIAKAREETLKRSIPPSAARERVGRFEGRIRSPHADENGWMHQLCKAFATRSTAVVTAFLAALEALSDASEEPDEVKLNAGLAIIAGARPRNEMQAAICAHMVCLNWLIMDGSRRCSERFDPYTASSVARLTRAFAQLAEQLRRLQGRPGRQNIIVKVERHEHRHVHMHTDGEGGGVENGSRPRGSRRALDIEKFSNRAPHDATAIEHEQRPALPGPDPMRDTMSARGDQGPKAVPHARGRGGFGRTEGREQRFIQDGSLDE